MQVCLRIYQTPFAVDQVIMDPFSSLILLQAQAFQIIFKYGTKIKEVQLLSQMEVIIIEGALMILAVVVKINLFLTYRKKEEPIIMRTNLLREKQPGSNQTIETFKKNVCSNSFSEYDKVKQLWKKECKSQILAEIKANGLQIEQRWAIQQESGSWLVFRDFEGSKIKDSRIAFPANTYLDPR